MDKETVREAISRLIEQNWTRLHPPAAFHEGETYIPYAGRVFDHEEVQAAVEAGLEFWLTAGESVARFEEKLAGITGAGKCLTVNSGSSANLLAVFTLTSPQLGERRLKAGDEIITTAACFPTTVAPIVQAGGIPVFVDIETGTYNASPDTVLEAITPRTRGVFLAHTLGNPFPAREMREICDERGLWLVEDNCDALGSTYQGQPTGSFGHLSTSSFYPAHHITTGEGGAVLTDDPVLAKIAASFRDWGRDCWCPSGKDNSCGKRYGWKLGSLPEGYDHKYIYSHLGFNLKMTEMQAAIGIAQLAKLPRFIKKRRENFRFLYEQLKPYEDALILPKWLPASEPSWFGLPLTVRPEAPIQRTGFVRYLEEKGVATRFLFAGNITRQPAFTGVNHRVHGDLGVTDLITGNLFWIVVYPGIGEREREYMAHCLRTYLDDHGSTGA